MPDSSWCARLMRNCVFIDCSKIHSKIWNDKNITAIFGVIGQNFGTVYNIVAANIPEITHYITVRLVHKVILNNVRWKEDFSCQYWELNFVKETHVTSVHMVVLFCHSVRRAYILKLVTYVRYTMKTSRSASIIILFLIAGAYCYAGIPNLFLLYEENIQKHFQSSF